MDLTDHIRRTFQYEWWANHATAESLGDGTGIPDRAIALMGHIVAAQRLWLSRIQQGDMPMPVWPAFTPQQCRAELQKSKELWGEFLAALSAETLAQPVPYVNSKGDSFTSSVGDILTHLIVHAAYHRGQINAMLRQAGHTPAYTDFIQAARTGAID
ncbi:MAG: DinB family protein [Chlorobi bacterium]|nr:MAG: DinB family protein [Chlorobi bacterium OLB7]MBK8910673.1 DinB family protein [Chlorobiota bacterium]